MWKYTVNILIKDWRCKKETTYIFRKVMWMPQLPGVTHLHLEELGYEVKIRQLTYFPILKEFVIDLESQEIVDGWFEEANFKDWSRLL